MKNGEVLGDMSRTRASPPIALHSPGPPHFDVICDQLQNRCPATWNLFVFLFFFFSLIPEVP